MFSGGRERVHWKRMGKHISALSCVSCRNRSIVLQGKSNDWFPYETQKWVEIG